MENMLRLMIPNHSVKCINAYLEVIRVLEANRAGLELNAQDKKQYYIYTKRFMLTHYALLASSIHFLRLWFYPPSHPKESFLRSDVVRIAHMDDPLNLLAIVLLALFFYYERKMFTTVHPIFLRYFYQVMNQNNLSEVFLPPYRHHGKPIMAIVKRNMIFMLKALAMLLIVARK